MADIFRGKVLSLRIEVRIAPFEVYSVVDKTQGQVLLVAMLALRLRLPTATDWGGILTFEEDDSEENLSQIRSIFDQLSKT